MIAHDPAGLDALSVLEKAREWHARRLLSDAQWQAVQAQFPSRFYSPNVFVRIGLGVFCLLLLLAAMGLAGVLVEPDGQWAFATFCLFWGAVWIVLLEIWAIDRLRHYGSGLDDMLLYVGISTMLAGLYAFLNYSTDTLVYWVFAWPFLVLGSLRYVDRLMTAAAFVCSFGIVLMLVDKIPKVALWLLPFAGMAFSAAVYVFARKGQQRNEWRHWFELLVVLELLGLVAFYASGNYYLVQQTAETIYQQAQPPLGGFFWVFTFGVPVAYIYSGLRHRERARLDLGLGAFGAALFTFRYYFHVLPLAWAAVAVGGFLFVVAYVSIHYLRKKRFPGYTYEPESKLSLLQEIEEQLLEQTIASQSPPVPAKPDTGFGGGQFGGGGAGSDF